MLSMQGTWRVSIGETNWELKSRDILPLKVLREFLYIYSIKNYFSSQIYSTRNVSIIYPPAPAGQEKKIYSKAHFMK